MTNAFKVASVIAKDAIGILENNLVMAGKIHRAHESEFGRLVNGYKKGDTITIRKPADFTVTDGAVMDVQDIEEGSTSLVINKRKHVAFQVTSQDMTLKLSQFRERVIKPAVIQLVNQVELDVMSLYKDVPNWVGTPTAVINSFSDFALAPERLDEFGVPMDMRSAVLSPHDYWGMTGSQTALYMTNPATDAYRRGSLGMIAGIDTYMAQNTPTHTVGVWASGSNVAVDGTLLPGAIEYASVKDTWTQTVTFDTFTASAPAVSAGDVFTIDGVYAVNPVTKAKLSFLKQFVVVSTANATGNQVDVTFSPPIIDHGAQQTIYTADDDLDGATITPVGTDSTAYRQNLVFHKNAFALAMVPLEVPAGAVDTARETKNGISIRVQPVYDGVNDLSKWRMDILYGVKTIDPRLAVRVNGTT